VKGNALHFEIGIENNVEGRSQAWALGHPGCFAYGPDGNAAFGAMCEVIINYAAWITRHRDSTSWLGDLSALGPDGVDLSLVETWEVYTIGPDFERTQEGYEVNAWFRHDWKPLTSQDLDRAKQLLAWSREDLLSSVCGLDQETLDAPHPGERWSIAGILQHVGSAEWWYLDRLGLSFSREQVPDDHLVRLTSVRERLEEILPSLVGIEKVVGIDGEFWSPRKLLRRAVWHERDHTQHILKIREI
jgi:hypothetical protein